MLHRTYSPHRQASRLGWTTTSEPDALGLEVLPADLDFGSLESGISASSGAVQCTWIGRVGNTQGTQAGGTSRSAPRPTRSARSSPPRPHRRPRPRPRRSQGPHGIAGRVQRPEVRGLGPCSSRYSSLSPTPSKASRERSRYPALEVVFCHPETALAGESSSAASSKRSSTTSFVCEGALATREG